MQVSGHCFFLCHSKKAWGLGLGCIVVKYSLASAAAWVRILVYGREVVTPPRSMFTKVFKTFERLWSSVTCMIQERTFDLDSLVCMFLYESVCSI